MTKLIARLAAVAFTAGTLALAAAAPAGAASVPEGTFGTVAGDAFLAAIGPAAQIHPASASHVNFGPQTGVEANTSFALTELAPGVYTVRWINGGRNAFGKYLSSTFTGGVDFSAAARVWTFSGGALTDGLTGRKLCLGPAQSHAISTVPGSSTAACADLQIVAAP